MLLCRISASLSGTDSNYHYLPPSILFILVFAFEMLEKPIMADKRAIKKAAGCGMLHLGKLGANPATIIWNGITLPLSLSCYEEEI